MSDHVATFYYYRNASNGQHVGPFHKAEQNARRMFERGGWEQQVVEVEVPGPEWDSPYTSVLDMVSDLKESGALETEGEQQSSVTSSSITSYEWNVSPGQPVNGFQSEGFDAPQPNWDQQQDSESEE